MLYAICAILMGVCIVLSRIYNFKLSTQIGIMGSTFFNYLVGLIFSTIFLLISHEKIITNVTLFKSIPWWAYLGGLVGIFVVAMQSYSSKKLSAFYLTIFIFIGQLSIGMLIDYITKHELSIGKIIGCILVIIGMIYNVYLDTKEI